ncbi:MAG: NADH:flavin oxidoreductase, partial [bacterium]
MSDATHASPPRVASLKTVAAFRRHLAGLPIAVACDDELLPPERSPLAQPYRWAGRTIGNRFAVHPMEGWDATIDGKPSELTRRRWCHFGLSGAKLVWGGEAVAIRHEGRANPRQLYYCEANRGPLEALLRELRQAHRERFGGAEDLVVGLQLTHSGRYCRPDPDWRLQPRVAYRHPILDEQFGVNNDSAVMSDSELSGLVEDYVAAARFASEAGFDFVDIKHCHGYLLHEFLSAHTRPGAYGGSFENRTRLLREIVAGIRGAAPGLEIGVRLSAFDCVPFAQPPTGAPARGVPVAHDHLLPYRFGFGLAQDDPLAVDLDEPISFLKLCSDLGISLVNITAGSPYYTPHLQRPALFPPSGGYRPPEDPLTGCARLLAAAAALKRAVPRLGLVGTGYTYFQEYLPLVAQTQIRLGHVDFVGIGRMVLCYPELPADVLSGKPLRRKQVCRTFSDCTTAPRNGMISGCYPLDDHYKARPEAAALKEL